MTFILPANFRQLPPIWEIAQPFQVDGSGAIAADNDPVQWAKNHILALLLTAPNERVMRPGYGIGLHNMVWENDTPLIEQQMTTAINMGLNMWEPSIDIIECEFIQQPMYSGIMELQIAFTVGNSPTINAVQINLGGTTVEVTA